MQDNTAGEVLIALLDQDSSAMSKHKHIYLYIC